MTNTIAATIIGIATRLLPGSEGEPDHINGLPAVAIMGDAGIVRVAPAGPQRAVVRVSRYGVEYDRSFAVSAAGAEEWLTSRLTTFGLDPLT